MLLLDYIESSKAASRATTDQGWNQTDYELNMKHSQTELR